MRKPMTLDKLKIFVEEELERADTDCLKMKIHIDDLLYKVNPNNLMKYILSLYSARGKRQAYAAAHQILINPECTLKSIRKKALGNSYYSFKNELPSGVDSMDRVFHDTYMKSVRESWAMIYQCLT